MVIDGTEILGTPIGSPSYVESKCVEISKSGQDLCTKLTELDDSQSALLLFQHCNVPRINHLARSVVPSCLQPAAKIHDELTRTTFNNIFKLESIDECKWRQATLKIKHRGFGLISTEESSSIAFVASWAHSIHELPLHFPSLQESVDTIHSTDLELPSQSLAYYLNSAFCPYLCLHL